MNNSRKKPFAVLLIILYIFFAFPINALGAFDTEPPVIEFLTNEVYKGLNVIYARDTREPAMSGAFYGFKVTDNQAKAFVDRTFVDKPAGPEEGVYAVLYNLEALSGFVAPAAAEVRLMAIDAAGNEIAIQAWCIVRDMDAPYYADNQSNAPNERENRLDLEPADDGALSYEGFISDRLVEQTGLGAIHIDTLPHNGGLFIMAQNGDEHKLSKKELPYSLSFDELRQGRMRYAPDDEGVKKDSFLFRAEDTLGNVASMQTLARLSLNTGYSAPIISGLPKSTDRRDKNSAAFNLDIEISDMDTPAIMLDVKARAQEGESRNATLTVSYLRKDTWRVRVSPTQNMTGICKYDIIASDPEGNEAALTYTLELVPPQLAVSAMDDGVHSGGNLHFYIDVLKNDLAFHGEALSIHSVTPPENGTVEIRGDKLYYEFKQGVQADAADSFTYTLSHDLKPRKGETLTASVYINDFSAPGIGEVTIDNAQAADWVERANITVAIDELTAISSVAVREIKRNASSLEEASDTVLMLEKAQDGTYTGVISQSGQFILDAVDVSGNRATRLIKVERVNGAAPVIKVDWKQLINGCVRSDFVLVSVQSAVDIEKAQVKSVAAKQLEGVYLEEAGNGVYRLYLGDESAKMLTLDFQDVMGHTASINLPELRRDYTPPVIEVENANEANAYYLPRYVRVYDEGCGLAQVSGLIMVEKGLYRTELSYDFTLTQAISAFDRWGNRADLAIKTLKLPNPGLLEGDDDIRALNDAISEIERELESITDTLLLTGAERAHLADLLFALRYQIELIELYQALSAEGPDDEQTQAYLRLMKEKEAMTAQRRELLSAPLNEALDEAFAISALAVVDTNIQDTYTALLESLDEQDEPGEAVFTLLEDTVVEGMAASAPGLLPESMDKLVELYNAVLGFYNMNLSTDDGFLLGMLTRTDYSPVPDEAEELMLYFETLPADQKSAEPPAEGYHFVNAYDVSLRMRSDGEASEPLELRPGMQALMGLRFDLSEDIYDVDSLRLIRTQEGNCIEQELLTQFAREDEGFVMTYASALGHFELYAKLSGTAAPEPDTTLPAPEPIPEPAPAPPAPERTPAPPEPELTPAPMPKAQATPEAAPIPAAEPSPSPTPESAGALPPVSIPSWPLYLIGGVTLLIFLCWVVVTLRRRNR